MANKQIQLKSGSDNLYPNVKKASGDFTVVSTTTLGGTTTINGETTINTPSGSRHALTLNPSSIGESSVTYYNADGTKAMYGGVGTGNVDGFGIYNSQTGMNNFTMGWDGQVTLNTSNNVWSGLRINAGSTDESSIVYYNYAKDKSYALGYHTGTADNFGLYSFETTQQLVTTDKNGHTWIKGNLNVDGATGVSGKLWGYSNGISTENTSDTWVPVLNNSTIQHRVIDNNINKTMSVLPVWKTSNGGSSSTEYNKWHHIGRVVFTNHLQGEFAFLRIFIGDGNNGTVNQNAYIDLTMQLGWVGGDTGGRAGCEAILHPMGTSFRCVTPAANVYMTIRATDNKTYDIYFLTTVTYCCPNVYFTGSTNTTFTHYNEYISGSLSGTECAFKWYTAYEQDTDWQSLTLPTGLSAVTAMIRKSGNRVDLYLKQLTGWANNVWYDLIPSAYRPNSLNVWQWAVPSNNGSTSRFEVDMSNGKIYIQMGSGTTAGGWLTACVSWII